MESEKSRFEALGADLWVIAAQKPGFPFDPAAYLLASPHWFPLLLDVDRSVTRAWGVYHRFGLDAYDIARPAAFVVGAQGKIRFLFVSSDQVERVTVEDLARALEAG